MANRGATGNSSTFQTNQKVSSPAIADQPQTGDPDTSSSSVTAPKISVQQGQVPEKVKWRAAAEFIVMPAWGAIDFGGSSLKHQRNEVYEDKKGTHMSPEQYNIAQRTQVSADLLATAQTTGDYSKFIAVAGAPIQGKATDKASTGGSFLDGISDFLNGLTSGATGLGKYSTYIIIAVVVIVLILILKR